MSKFYNVSPEEQETIINIDYKAKEVKCYTSRSYIYDRLIKKLGDPSQTFYANKKICGATWTIPFDSKKMLSSIFSRPTIIGNC